MLCDASIVATLVLRLVLPIAALLLPYTEGAGVVGEKVNTRPSAT